MTASTVFGLDLDNQPWKEYVLIFSFVVFFWETYLNLRQHKMLGMKTIPAKVHKAFEPHLLSTDDFEKSRVYSLDKSTYNFFSSAFSQLETTLVFTLNFLPWAWGYAGTLRASLGYNADAEIVQSVIFVGLLTLISTLVNMPLSLYYTFVIEARHGFNKQTIGLYFSDSIKTLLLTAVIGVKIDALAKSVEFPLTKVFVVDGSKRSSHSNAYFFGLFKNKRIVIFDTLLEQATHNEVLAILAHELGHWQFSHTTKRLAIIQTHLFMVFFLFSKVIALDSLYMSFGFDSKPIIIGFLLFQFIFTPAESIMGFVMNLISRHDEFQADSYAKKLNYATDLKNGLIKIHLKNSSNLNPDKLYSIWHYSHPPLVERLSAIIKSKSE
ncbi:hypothetical protein BASA81_013869 [Batrachochytrium salamandrivorans]|nr:hypothetical protein BASA81_013869 [Batrachochytrium salamandrivorans]